MQAMYRKPREGEKAESWEGIKFISAVAKTALEVDQMISDGWVTSPLDLDDAKPQEQPKRRGRPPKE